MTQCNSYSYILFRYKHRSPSFTEEVKCMRRWVNQQNPIQPHLSDTCRCLFQSRIVVCMYYSKLASPYDINQRHLLPPPTKPSSPTSVSPIQTPYYDTTDRRPSSNLPKPPMKYHCRISLTDSAIVFIISINLFIVWFQSMWSTYLWSSGKSRFPSDVGDGRTKHHGVIIFAENRK